MNRFPEKTTNFGDRISQQIQPHEICGSKKLFCDRYEILQILGKGGFGITFLAKNIALPGSPLCVIKQLCPKVTSPQSWQRACIRFEKEAETLAKLGSHSQIPMLIDYFQVNKEFYLVQEYIPGSTLAAEVQRTGTKSEASVKQFLQQILPVLQYLHQHRVIHRDIKPHNLLRRDDGQIVLIDFGAVKEKLTDVYENSINLSANTNFIGTIGFAPPEQFSLRPVYASDIYALGVTCIYMLTGKSPLKFKRDINTGEFCWQEEVNISYNFTHFLEKMVNISLHDRFKSADEVIKALDKENDFYELANCLTMQKFHKKTVIHNEIIPEKITPQKIIQEENSDAHLSPIGRTAAAIRRWRGRPNLTDFGF